MNKTHKDKMADILRKYLSQITYIDDEFIIGWEERKEVEEEPDRPRRARSYIGKGGGLDGLDIEDNNGWDRGNTEEGSAREEKAVEKDSLWNFCVYMQKMYPNISLVPVPYSADTTMDALQNYIDSAKLLVIDWKLDDSRKTAIDVIKNSNFKNMFKLCVIYTSDLPQAEDSFRKNMGFSEEKIKKEEDKGRQYIYVIDNANLFMLCEKRKFTFEDIVEVFSTLFIREIGFFSISFIEMFAHFEKKIPQYLNDFKEPFDSLLLLQTVSDQMPLAELNYEFDNMVINTLKDDIHLDLGILEGIYHQKIGDIRKIITEETGFKARLQESIERVCKSIGEGRKVLGCLKKIEEEKYKKLIGEAISNEDQLYKSIEKAGADFAEMYLKIKFENDINKIALLRENDKGKLWKIYKQAELHEIKEKVIDAIPVFLMILLEPEKEWNQTLRKLLCMLKVRKYDKESIKLENIFRGCYNQDENGNFELQKVDGKNYDWSLIHNKIKQGDVFLKYNEEDEKKVDACYLCIMPACHTLRPEKIDGKVQLISGTVNEIKPNKRIRQSEHLTMLPNPKMESRTLYVTWQFHDIMTLNLVNLQKEVYFNFCRVYRLDDDYIRQIMGKFISFYSKVGVEEIFAKSNVAFPRIIEYEGRYGK